VESGPAYVAVDGSPRPRLSHRIAVIDGDEPGMLRVRIEVRNLGEGPAEGVRALLKRPDSEAVELVEANAKIERLESGATGALELAAKLLESLEEPIQLDLVLAEEKFRTVYETKVELTRHDGFGSWEEAPEIQISGLVPDGDDGSYKVIAKAIDDKGLATVWCSVNGRKIDYIDTHDEPKRKLHFDVPWRPSSDVQRVEIIATDADGMTTSYVTDL
jgi:hypothetical protein